MRIEIKEIKIYTFKDAPKEVRGKIIEMFSNCPYHYEHHMSERIATLKKLAEVLEGDLDYSLSCVPDRGEYITIKPRENYSYDDSIDDHILNYQALWDLINVDKECPLTGVCYDDDLLDDLSKYGIQTALNNYIKSIHNEYEDMISEEYLSEHCEANGYEFNEDGNIYN